MSFHLLLIVSAAALLKREWSKKARLGLQNAVRITLPMHRASACLRHRLGTSSVTVSATQNGGTRLSGLMVCDAHHICPVCHHNKMARDQATVAEITEAHYIQGGFMVDAVFTVPHSAGEALSVVLKRLSDTWKALRSKPIWREITDGLGVIGCMRRLEVTLTKNGWHPHFHVSFLCDWRAAKKVKGHNRRSALEDVDTILTGLWVDAGKKAGVKVSMAAQSAVALVAAVDAARAVAYSAKNMGFGRKSDSLTPMDLLRIIDQSADQAEISAAKQYFKEYASGIKGKHVLSFFGTARDAKASIEDVADVSPSVEVERLGAISGDGWDAVIMSGQRELIAQVTTREELTTAVFMAASVAGYTSVPLGWLVLAPETKTVIGVKSSVSIAESMAA